MIDRRKDSREFLVSGWDPYVISLTADARQRDEPPAEYRAPPTVALPAELKDAPKPVITRWRAMLLKGLR